MTYTLQPFATWADLLAYVSDPSSDANRGLKYRAPMDLASVYVDVVRVYKNGKLRIRSGTSDLLTFTADAGHLDRFLRRVAGSVDGT